jgi:hypothetical protein
MLTKYTKKKETRTKRDANHQSQLLSLSSSFSLVSFSQRWAIIENRPVLV